MTEPTLDERLSAIIRELQGAGITLDEARDAFTEKYVAHALVKTKGNVSRAAQLLGVHRNTLHIHKRRESLGVNA